MLGDITKDLDDMFEDIINPQPQEEISEFVSARIVRNFAVLTKAFEFIKEAGLYDEAFICGGVVRHSCSRRRPIPAVYGDIDIYCRFDEAYNKLKTVMDGNTNYKIQFENDLSVAYIKNRMNMGIQKPIQLIKPMREGQVVTTGTMKEILNNFDFTVIRAGVNIEMFALKMAMVDEDFHKHEMQKKLVFKKIHCPISSLHRCIKYGRKGYKLNSKESLKLFLDWEKRPQTYKNEIIEFLAKTFEPTETTGELSSQDQLEINRMYRMLRVD